MSETNYFVPTVDIRWIMTNTVTLSQQFTYCLEECNKFIIHIQLKLML